MNDKRKLIKVDRTILDMFEKPSSTTPINAKHTLTQSSIASRLHDDPIQQYNYVLQHYNMDENQINNIKLEPMSESSIHSSFWRIFSRPCLLFIYLIFILVPVLGSILYLWLVAACIVYFSALSMYNTNKDKVPDPLQNMIFSPELCRVSNNINRFYDIRLRDLAGFSFNTEVISSLKLKNQGESLRFMVYNGKFWDFYNKFPKYKGRYIFTWIIATMFLIGQGILIYLILRSISE